MLIHRSSKDRMVVQMNAYFYALPRSEKTGLLTSDARAAWRQWCDAEGISTERARQLMKEQANPTLPKINVRTEQKYIAYLKARGYTVEKR